MNDLSLQELKSQIELSNNLLRVANTEIEKLRSQANFSDDRQYQSYKKILSENHELMNILQNNVKDLRDYNNQFYELQKEIINNEIIIKSLTKENQELKLKLKEKKDQNKSKKIIRGVNDIRESFGFNLKKRNNKEEQKENEKEKEDFSLSKEREKEFEKLKKQKIDIEQALKINQEKVIKYLKEKDTLKTYAMNYSNYIDSVNEQIRSFNQQIKVSVIGEEKINFYKSCGEKIKQLTKEMEDVNAIIKQMNDDINSIEIRTLVKIENIITKIDSKLSEINNNTNLDYYFLSIRIYSILNSSDDLNKIIITLQTKINAIKEQDKQIDKYINDLKINIEKFIESYQEGKKKMNAAIKKTLRKTGKDIFNSINKSIRNEKVEEKEELIDKIEEEPEKDVNLLKSSTLIGVKDFGKNIDLFKSTILFQDKNIAQENKTTEAKLLRKNWHEVCYIYDDYDIHDIHFELKAVGLGAFSFFNSASVPFYLGKIIEILEFEINGKKSDYRFDGYFDFDIHLNNLESAKVHLKYKESPKFKGDKKNEKLIYSLYRKEYYGLMKSLSGQMGKYSLILKGSLSIISFRDDFFILNENNKKEKEYIWGGKIPPEGKETLVTLSKTEATWKFYSKYEIISKYGTINHTTLTIPLRYVGGNNEIIKMDYSSPQTKNISIDEENRKYEINYFNTGKTKVEFILQGEIKNRCKGDWELDITDEMVEAHTPQDVKRDKANLEKIARKIIEDFDKKNKNSMFNYKDYMKIGRWVYENIKYDFSYIGRTELTAMDIYNKRAGVCSHFTRLSNALLYSLGYKAFYVHGFACEDTAKFEEDCKHAWSLVKVDGKWYPFDSTWNILSGKLPVCHVFQGYFTDSDREEYVSRDSVTFGELRDDGEFIW